MRIVAASGLLLIGELIASAQGRAQSQKKTARKVPPECARGAICFSGEVRGGQEFRKALDTELEFVIKPGWTIAIVPTKPEGDCNEFADIVNSPYREHKDLYIDTSYGHKAEDEVSDSPRDFRFVTNCADYRTESVRFLIVMGETSTTEQKYDEALAKLGTSARGTGRLWITDSKISHSGGTPDGRIEWMSFTVEIILPHQ
jgi:hypothetical protein